MKRVMNVVGKISVTELRATDEIGRSRVLVGGDSYQVGDSILVVNDVIIKKVRRREVRTYDV